MKRGNIVLRLGLACAILLLTAGVVSGKQPKVDVCHICGTYDFGDGPVPIGHVITVAVPAYPAHIAHGNPVSWHLVELRDGRIVCVADTLPPDLDNDGDGYTENEGDCDDADATVFPGAPELCDNKDNDCDGEVDEEFEFAEFYLDADGDGYGTADTFVIGCACPSGYVLTGTDCDDTDAAIHPGATETCGDDIDQDCTGDDLSCDDVDNDGDGYTENEGDCDDADASVHPGATEVCGDGLDQDCDGEDLACTYLVQPFFKCTEVVFGQYFVHFSYENRTSETITVPLGPNNYLIPTTLIDTQPPTVFEPGFHDDVFSTSFEGTKDWVLCTNGFCLIASARTSETDFCTGSYGALTQPRANSLAMVASDRIGNEMW